MLFSAIHRSHMAGIGDDQLNLIISHFSAPNKIGLIDPASYFMPTIYKQNLIKVDYLFDGSIHLHLKKIVLESPSRKSAKLQEDPNSHEVWVETLQIVGNSRGNEIGLIHFNCKKRDSVPYDL